MLARTCKVCGKLADGDSFPIISSVGARRRACHTCVNLAKKRDREERGIGLPPSRRPPEDQQTSKYMRWEAWEDKYLTENVAHMSYEELAVALGRSLHSVYTRRAVLGIAAVRVSHRVAEPWKIQL